MEVANVKSAARAIQVLEFFDAAKRASAVADVADHYGWPHSSTSALMRTLVSLGYLHYDASGRSYMPSMRVALLGDWLHESLLAHGRLSALLQQLHRETHETVVLAAQNGLHSQYLRVIEGTNTLRMHLQHGMLRPLLTSGTGRILMTQMEAGAIRKLVRKHNLRDGQDQPVEVEEVLAQVDEDRARGYAFSKNRITAHAGLIAMLLPTSACEKPLAIGVAGLTERLVANEQRYVAAMHEAIGSLAAI
ncbi:MAG: IclR family transcriptional regulator [Ramlibacter sp.]